MYSQSSLKRIGKRSLLWLPLSIVLIAVLIAASSAPTSTPAGTRKGSGHAGTSQPVQGPAVGPVQANTGNPIDLSIDSTQDQTFAADQNDAVTAAADPPSGGHLRVHRGFASMSIETQHVCNLVLDGNQAKLANIYKNLGPGGVIRVGGGSVDDPGLQWDGQSTLPCPTATIEDITTLTPPMIEKLFRFAHSIGWRVIWSVGLLLTPAQAADQAAAAVNISNQIDRGPNAPLLAIAIGNEPEIDLPAAQQTYQQFLSIWDADAQAIKARVPTVRFSAPDTCCTDNDQWFKDFVKDRGTQIQIAANHLYPTNADTQHPTMARILSPQLRQDMIDWMDGLYQAASAQNLPLALTETNSMAGSPTPEIGLAFGQSLWTADYLFFALEHGVVGLNFHGGVRGDATSPIHGDEQSLTVQATYYGMLFYQQAAASGGHTVPVKAPPITDAFNLAAHAIRGRDGKLYVALINKGAQSYELRVNSGRVFPQNAQVLRMTGPSVDAQTGITVGGSTINNDGTWAASQIETLPVTNNTATLNVPAYSAALVIFSPSGS